MNNEICSVNIKLEHEDVDNLDNQIPVCETPVYVNSIKLKNDPLVQYETSSLDNMKMELCTDNIQHNELNSEIDVEHKVVATFPVTAPNAKKEYESNYLNEEIFTPGTASSEICKSETSEIKIEEEIISAHVKLEISSKQFCCKIGHENYEEYCIKCRRIVHILDRNVFSNMSNKARAEVPRNILEYREVSGRVGIFALQVISENVNFGPFTGLNTIESVWKIKRNRFVVDNDRLKYMNWMQYINSARRISDQNLLIFQCEGNLYYRSIREIQVGEELLVHFGEEYKDNMNNDVEMTFNPVTEPHIETVFACTFCCLGFNSKVYLAEHKTTCPNGNNGCTSIEDITQCLFCKIFMEQKEYLQYHMDYCYEKNARQCLLPTPASQTMKVKELPPVPNKAKRQYREAYNCPQCRYKTKYKSDLKKHTNKHYQVKAYSCSICLKRFKRRETLKRHMFSIHASDLEKKEAQPRLKRKYQCAKCVYETFVLSHFKNHLISHKEVKQLECSDCEFRTNYKYNLTAHRLEKHLSSGENAKQLKCFECGYVTHRKDYHERHLNKHQSVKRFKCPECDYETYRKDYLKRHFYRHETVKRFKCIDCNFVTNYKSNLRAHRVEKHLNSQALSAAKRFKCDDCVYSTNSRGHFNNHMYTHGSLKRFKCDHCDYCTNHKSDLKRHADVKHFKMKMYKCSKCTYEAADKDAIQRHRYTHVVDDDERKFKCSICGYRTTRNSYLTVHVNTKHSGETEKYKCSECDYEVGSKTHLERHVYLHTGLKRFKCSECLFETNYKCSLNKHRLAKHPEVKELKR